MVRQPRLDLPGSLQLVSGRGIGRCLIFRDDQDRMSFVAKFHNITEETETRCYAWSLLPRSFNLLLGINTVPLSTVMRRLTTAYASKFNHRYGRIGPLFYSRYKSTLCEKEPCLLEMVRRVHLKPLQAGVVRDLSELDQYPWTGHYALMNESYPQKPQDVETANPLSISANNRLRPSSEGTRESLSIANPRPVERKAYSTGHQSPARGAQSILHRAPIDNFLVMDEVLLCFSGNRKEARHLYREFLDKGSGQGKSDLVCSGYEEGAPSDRRILGSREFVAATLKEAGDPTEPKVKRISLQELCDKVRCHFDVDEEDMRSPIKKKQEADAKAVFCYLAIRKMGYYGVEVGDYLNMRGFSANRAAERGKTILQTNGLDPYAFL